MLTIKKGDTLSCPYFFTIFSLAFLEFDIGKKWDNYGVFLAFGNLQVLRFVIS